MTTWYDRDEVTNMSKTAMYLIYFCIYSLILLVIGKRSLRFGTSPRDYFISDRRVGTILCVCTFTGTWVSAITILSLTGSVYEDGLAVLLYSVIPWFFGAFLLALVLKRLRQTDAITVPEMFGLRYRSCALQVVYGVITMLVYIFYLVAQYKGFGMVASEVFNIPYPTAVGMVYLFIIYTTFGGYRSVVQTDLFNLCLLFVSLVTLCIALVSKSGGLLSLYEQAGQISSLAVVGTMASAHDRTLLSLFGGRYTPLISFSMFWGWGLGLSANPQYIVRLLSAKDDRTAKRTILLSILILAIIYFALIHIGLSMRVLVPTMEQAQTTDNIFVHLINNELYGPWSGLFLFSVIGACVSTANSQLLVIASSFSYDIVRSVSRKPLTDKQVVSLGRVGVFLGGTVAMLLTLDPPAFTLSYGGDLWGIFSILLFPQLYGELLTHRVTKHGVWAGLIVGGISIAIFYPMYYRGALAVHPAVLGVPLSALAVFLASAWDRKWGHA